MERTKTMKKKKEIKKRDKNYGENEQFRKQE